jgi:hypothetical protein
MPEGGFPLKCHNSVGCGLRLCPWLAILYQTESQCSLAAVRWIGRCKLMTGRRATASSRRMGMQEPQGGALLDDRPTPRDAAGARATLRESHGVWIATEGSENRSGPAHPCTSSYPLHPRRRVRRACPAWPRGPLHRRLHAGRDRCDPTGGHRPGHRDAGLSRGYLVPGARGRRVGGGGGGADGCLARPASAGPRDAECERTPRLPRGWRPASRDGVEARTTEVGRDCSGPNCGGIDP